MANPEHLRILDQGAKVWNQWRKENSLVRADLSGADLDKVRLDGADFTRANLRRVELRGARLSGANFTRAELPMADFSGADLSRARLSLADLFQANLRRADIRRADLSEARLTGANLSLADLFQANLNGANLDNVNLSGANLGNASLTKSNLHETIFSDTDLSTTRGLETCTHFGPSTLDHRTLQKSGTLPLKFLRGCGLPDSLIDYLPSLLNEPIQYHSCFISYSHKDEDFAKRLYASLQNAGIRVWYAPEDMQGGQKLHEQLEQAIQRHDRLLLVLSEKSMNSEWVATEIYTARQREVKEKRRILFPLRLVDFEAIRAWKCFDADTGKDMGREIREYFIPDFSNWKDHDAFEQGFARVLRDLKASEKTGSPDRV